MENKFNLLKKQLILKDPSNLIRAVCKTRNAKGGFAAVMARAGVGKTAFLVQIGLGAMLEGKAVIHISTGDSVDKVDLWYREVYRRFTEDQDDIILTKRFWENALSSRFIMSFDSESFSLLLVQKRIEELVSQKIFLPEYLIIDGINEQVDPKDLSRFRDFTSMHGISCWLSVRIPAESIGEIPDFIVEPESEQVVPDHVFFLTPGKERISLSIIETVQGSRQIMDNCYLDPTTLLIRCEAPDTKD